MELSFLSGDVIYVYGDMDEDGFYLGDLNSLRGLVPCNFLSETTAEHRHVSSRAPKLKCKERPDSVFSSKC
jgi:hypothetical protein